MEEGHVEECGNIQHGKQARLGSPYQRTDRGARRKVVATPLPAYFVVTYLITWGFFFAGSLTPAAWPRGLLFLLGTFAPGYVALWFTSRETGRGGVAALLRRLVEWRVPARWYAFAAGYIVVIKLTVALVPRAVTGAGPLFGRLPWYLMLAATLFSTVVGGQSGEEVGWRGYALPRLAMRWGLGPASLLVGILWACWHLPLFYLHGADTYRQSFPLYAVQVVALSVVIAWLWWRTGGSLLLAM